MSTFAFTATPKEKTLELFGQKGDDGKYRAFSLYSMRQAIEQGLILDVLQNYTTHQTYWKLLKTAEDDPTYERDKAHRLLKAFVEPHDHAIGEKLRIMVEHFRLRSQRRTAEILRWIPATSSPSGTSPTPKMLDAHLRVLLRWAERSHVGADAAGLDDIFV